MPVRTVGGQHEWSSTRVVYSMKISYRRLRVQLEDHLGAKQVRLAAAPALVLPARIQGRADVAQRRDGRGGCGTPTGRQDRGRGCPPGRPGLGRGADDRRSEEHTSELQSQSNLV